MGPGTHVVKRVLGKVKPSSYTDQIALRHDLDYLDNNKEPIVSDIKAIIKTDNSLQSLAMRVGLTTRSIFDILEHLAPFGTRYSHINGRTDKLDLTDKQLFEHLNSIVKEQKWEQNDY